MQEGSMLVVQSTAANICSVEILDLSGSQISKVQADSSQHLTTKITSGVQIVRIELNDGTSRKYKMMFK